MIKVILVMISIGANGAPNGVQLVMTESAESCRAAIEAAQKSPMIVDAVNHNKAAFICAPVDIDTKGV